MEPETRSTLRWTVGSALAWGGLFLAVAAVQAGSQGFSPLEVAAPLVALALIGFTVGGLTGPLVRRLWIRFTGGEG